jgi:DNA polymerase (family 10)
MSDNREISEILNIYAKLYDLHGGNSFKVRSLSAAAYNIKKIGEDLSEMDESALAKIPQIGKTLASKVYEILQTGTFKELEDLISDTPKGVIDLLKIKGLGPKKVEVLWKEVGIASVPELLDACRENRLVEIKGFGLKTQAQILSDIEFKFNNEGKWHWAKAHLIVQSVDAILNACNAIEQFQVCGDYRRLNDIVNSIDYLIELNNPSDFIQHLLENEFEMLDDQVDRMSFVYRETFNIQFNIGSPKHWGNQLVKHTSTEEHLKLIQFDGLAGEYENEEAVYNALNLPYILPELREGLNELKHLDQQDKLITYKDLKGVLHNHTTYSDGIHSIEEMAGHARHMGLEYIGICDHSQTAAYAGGLRPEKVLEQMQKIDALNAKLNELKIPFKIYKGIESDILGDGSLDYTEDILQMFDLVVASVHSNLNMDEDKANTRLIKAIENPYTTILGHPTGRLLLMRKGYPINQQYIIDACVANGVAIELNAHPYRLDLDWRHINYAINKGGLISINPDAHQKEGLEDMRFGVNVARKGYLTAEHCLNAKNTIEFEKWLENKSYNSRKKPQ